MKINDSVTNTEILNKGFSSSLMGYNKSQVDSYLEKISKQIDRLNVQIVDLKKTMENNVPIDKSQEELIAKTLVLAEQTRDDVIGNAKKEAEVLLKEAELKAKKMINDAKHYVSVIEHQISLVEERKRLFVTRFRSELQAMLEGIDSEEYAIVMDKKDQ
jgi:cell division initiation protein